MIIYGVGGYPVFADSYQHDIVRYFQNREDAERCCAEYNKEYQAWADAGFPYTDDQPRFQDMATITEITVE
jgi:hypothetical protein